MELVVVSGTKSLVVVNVVSPSSFVVVSVVFCFSSSSLVVRSCFQGVSGDLRCRIRS